MVRLIRSLLPLLLLSAALGATAQERVVQAENVKLDYAQVLNVEPVYQTLRASRTEQVCDELPTLPTTTVHPPKEQSRWSRFIDSIKGVFTSEDNEARAESPDEQMAVETAHVRCRTVPVEREFRRPIAYDVDYVPLPPGRRPGQPPAHPGFRHALRAQFAAGGRRHHGGIPLSLRCVAAHARIRRL